MSFTSRSRSRKYPLAFHVDVRSLSHLKRKTSIRMTDYVERVRAIKRAAKIRFDGASLEFAQAKESNHPQFLADDPLSWKLIIRKDGVTGCVLFNLGTDHKEEAIERQLDNADLSRREVLGTF